ncbi:MAG: RidA family protein [Firmicutes bacterium]|nr:RidA family protein [Bacillota bacterium]
MSKQVIHTTQAPAALGPYSQAICCGNLVFCSGQVGLNSAGVLAQGLTAQTEQCLNNMQAVLQEAGSSMEKVVKCTIFLTDMNDFAAVNEIYGQFFPSPYPARSCIQVCALPKGGLVEIEAIAEI